MASTPGTARPRATDDGVFDGAIKTVDGIAVRVSPLLDNNTVASTQTLL